jgi:hypothetical protein
MLRLPYTGPSIPALTLTLDKAIAGSSFLHQHWRISTMLMPCRRNYVGRIVPLMMPWTGSIVLLPSEATAIAPSIFSGFMKSLLRL